MERHEHLKRIDGYLFSKLFAIGTRSEGPQYFLQGWDYREERIVKDALKGENDLSLHGLLGKRVNLLGKRAADGIHYARLAPLKDKEPQEEGKKSGLKLSLDVEAEALNVNQYIRVVDGKVLQHFDLTLFVGWPRQNTWRGTCPTTQAYDFSIWRNGEEFWRWSEGRTFADVATSVYVPQGEPTEFSVTCHFSPEEILEEGTYVARATFIASGESVEKPFVVSIIRR